MQRKQSKFSPRQDNNPYAEVVLKSAASNRLSESHKSALRKFLTTPYKTSSSPTTVSRQKREPKMPEQPPILSSSSSLDKPRLSLFTVKAIHAAIWFLRTNALGESGIFRVCGKKKEVDELADAMVKRGENIAGRKPPPSPFACADAIKRVLREHRPLVPRSSYREVLAVAASGNGSALAALIKRRLPEPVSQEDESAGMRRGLFCIVEGKEGLFVGAFIAKQLAGRPTNLPTDRPTD